jgi:hypothetical protein
MIRLATIEDIPKLVKLGVAFHEATQGGTLLSMDTGHLSRSLRRLIQTHNSSVIVLDVGGIKGTAALTTSFSYFNSDAVIGYEQFYWIYPEARGQYGRLLLSALEDEAKRLKCTHMMMIALESLEPDRVGMLYKRLGYRPLEHIYMKAL